MNLNSLNANKVSEIIDQYIAVVLVSDYVYYCM